MHAVRGAMLLKICINLSLAARQPVSQPRVSVHANCPGQLTFCPRPSRHLMRG